MREQKFRFIFKDGNFFAKRYMTLDELLDSIFALEQMEESINSESNIFDIEDFPDSFCPTIKEMLSGESSWKPVSTIERKFLILKACNFI